MSKAKDRIYHLIIIIILIHIHIYIDLYIFSVFWLNLLIYELLLLIVPIKIQTE